MALAVIIVTVAVVVELQTIPVTLDWRPFALVTFTRRQIHKEALRFRRLESKIKGKKKHTTVCLAEVAVAVAVAVAQFCSLEEQKSFFNFYGSNLICNE